MGYIKGSDRSQGMLLPQTIDDYIGENNAVRAIAAFLERVDFVKLGFVRARAADTGRPGYDPRLLMGLYLWGSLNGLCSSRKLAHECQRNLEVIWLCENLHPDFKTIADFRAANAAGIRGVVVEFRRWCLAAGLYGKEIVAVDGSKFKAVNSKQRNYTREKLQQLLVRERAKINEYLEAMDAADAAEAAEEETELTAAQLKEKIASLDRYLAAHEQLAADLEKSGNSQVSLTDPDAKLMKTARGSEVSYNVQTVVDSKLKLLVTYAVTNEANDLRQLAVLGQAAQEALGIEALTVLADGGYYEGNALKECEEAGLITYVPEPQSGAANHRGVFANRRFHYDAERLVEAERVEHERRAVVEAGAVLGPEPARQPARGAGHRLAARVAPEALGQLVQAALELRTSAASAPFCGPNTRGASSNGVCTSQSTSMSTLTPASVERLERAGAAVRGGRAAHGHDHALHAGLDRRDDQLAGPARGGRPRVALVLGDQPEPARPRHLHDRRPAAVDQGEGGVDRPAERIGDRDRAQLAVERRQQRVDRALAAVRHRQLLGRAAGGAQAARRSPPPPRARRTCP